MNPLPRVTQETLEGFLQDIRKDGYFISVMEQVKAENEKIFSYLLQYHVGCNDTPYMTSALITYSMLQRQMQTEHTTMPLVSEDTLENVIEIITTRNSSKEEARKQVLNENPIIYNAVTNIVEDPKGMIIMYALLRSQQVSDQLKEEFNGS